MQERSEEPPNRFLQELDDGDRSLLVRGAARTPSRRPNRCLRFALSPVLVKMLMADSGEWKTSERLLFQGSSVYRHDIENECILSQSAARAPPRSRTVKTSKSDPIPDMIIFLLCPFEPAWSRLSALHRGQQTPYRSPHRLRPSKSLETRAGFQETNESPQANCRRDATRLSGN